jgi:Sec-independent protein translocase protein TatA
LGGRGKWISEFKTSLVRETLSQKTKQNKKTNKQKNKTKQKVIYCSLSYHNAKEATGSTNSYHLNNIP